MLRSKPFVEPISLAEPSQLDLRQSRDLEQASRLLGSLPAPPRSSRRQQRPAATLPPPPPAGCEQQLVTRWSPLPLCSCCAMRACTSPKTRRSCARLCWAAWTASSRCGSCFGWFVGWRSWLPEQHLWKCGSTAGGQSPTHKCACPCLQAHHQVAGRPMLPGRLEYAPSSAAAAPCSSAFLLTSSACPATLVLLMRRSGSGEWPPSRDTPQRMPTPRSSHSAPTAWCAG